MKLLLGGGQAAFYERYCKLIRSFKAYFEGGYEGFCVENDEDGYALVIADSLQDR